MPIQFKIFRIPCQSNSQEELDMNSFLRSVQTLTVHRDFVDAGIHSFQLFTVEYLDKDHAPGKVYICQVDSIGKNELLFPNSAIARQQNPITPGVTYQIPENTNLFPQIEKKWPCRTKLKQL